MMVAERPELRIIDADLWTDVQSKLAESTRGRKKRPTVRRSRYLLSGIVVCDECGKPLTIYGSTTSYYRCQTRHAKGACSNDLRVREDVLRRECIEAIRDQVQKPANIAYVREKVAELIESHAGKIKNELAMRRDRLKRGEARAQELHELLRRGPEAASGFAEELREIEARAEADRAAIARLKLEAIDGTGLPDPDEITAQAFRVQEVLAGDIFRARHALSVAQGRADSRAAGAGWLRAPGRLLPATHGQKTPERKTQGRRVLGSRWYER
jgi:hypothetical protein